MKAFRMNTSRPLYESDVLSEINPFGWITWRDNNITIMFANIDTTQSQPIIVSYSYSQKI